MQVRGCFKGFSVPRYQHGNLHAVEHSAPSLQSSEVRQLTAVSTIEHESRADVPEATNADTQNAGVHLAHRVQFAPDDSCQWCTMFEDPCSRVHFLYDAQQPATCERCGPVYTAVGVFNKRREGVRKNVLSIVLPCDLDDETAILPPPDLPTPRGIPGTRSQDTKRADGLHVYPSPLVYEDQPLPSSTVVQAAAQEVTLASLIEKHAAAHSLKVKLLSEHAVLPTRGSSGAAGFDLYAPPAVTIAPDQQEKILVDLAVELRPLTCGSIRDRSGNAIKHRLRVGGGLVDQDFRGNIGVVSKNEGSKPQVVHPGDKIAQMTIDLCLQPAVMEVREMSNTDRGSKEWGSTDVRPTSPPPPAS